MHTRIKYNFEGPIGISRQSFKISTGQEVRVVVDKAAFSFEILDVDGNLIEKGGKTKNYAVLLRQAKRTLTKLGYDFGTEDRDRDYGVVRKGENNA